MIRRVGLGFGEEEKKKKKMTKCIALLLGLK